MSKAGTGSPPTRKRTGLWRLLVVALFLGAAITYLGQQGPSLTQFLPAVEGSLTTPALKEAAKPEEAAKQEAAKPVQAPSALAPSFDVAYVDETGKLVAAGRGEAGWTIRLGSKTEALGETKADENNEWLLTLEKPLSLGVHTLSLQAIAPDGQQSVAGKREIVLSVLTRKEVRQKEAGVHGTDAPGANVPVTQMATGEKAQSNASEKDCDLRVVRKGDTLWEIAHHCYGDGTKFTKIHQSNRDLIRNPDLIYPDQKFTVPH